MEPGLEDVLNLGSKMQLKSAKIVLWVLLARPLIGWPGHMTQVRRELPLATEFPWARVVILGDTSLCWAGEFLSQVCASVS